MQENQNVNNISETEIKKEKIIENGELNQDKSKNTENEIIDPINEIKDNNMSSNSEESSSKSFDDIKIQRNKEYENKKNTDLKNIKKQSPLTSSSDVDKNQKETKKYNETAPENKDKISLEKSKEENKNKEKNIKIEDVYAVLEETEERIDEIIEKMENLDIDEIKKAIGILKSHKEQLKNFENNNKEAEILYWKTKDLRTLLSSIKDLKTVEQKTENTKKLLKKYKKEYEISQEINKKIKQNNEDFEKIIKKITENIKDKYDYHIKEEGKENVFYIENLKNMVKKLKASLEQYKKANENLNSVGQKINQNKMKLEEIKGKMKEINEIANEKNWSKYTIPQLKNAIEKLNNIKKLVEKLKGKKADEIYFKISDFKIVLKSQVAYLKGLKLSCEAEKLKDLIINNSKENSVEKDVNEKIKKFDKEISKSKKKILRMKEELEEILKVEDKDFMFFKTEITYQLSGINFLYSRLNKIEEELKKAPEIAIEQITLNVKDEAKYLKNKRLRLENLYGEDEEYEENEKEEAEKTFIKEIDEFKKLYEQSCKNLNYISKESAKDLKEFYEGFNIESLKMAL